MIRIAIVILLFAALFPTLYEMQLLTFRTTRAVLFAGSFCRKQLCRAKFSSCSGKIRRRLRFSESRSYRFELTAPLEKGSIEICVLDPSKMPVLTLTPENPRAEMQADPSARYTLMITFQSASGELELTWN